jgi:hypothetical protein
VESDIREKKHDEVLVDTFTVLATFLRVNIPTIPAKIYIFIYYLMYANTYINDNIILLNHNSTYTMLLFYP